MHLSAAHGLAGNIPYLKAKVVSVQMENSFTKISNIKKIEIVEIFKKWYCFRF